MLDNLELYHGKSFHFMLCRRVFIVVLALSAFVLTISCEHDGLFSHTEPEPVTTIPDINSDEVIVHLKISGGSTGIEHDLFILKNRTLEIYDNYPDNGSLNRILSQEEMDQLRLLFSDNNFFSIQNELDESTDSPALLYEITYKQDDLVHTIATNSSEASNRARAILDALLVYFNELRESLNILLETDKTEITTSRYLRMVMQVENNSDRDLELVYMQGQAFDYVVYQISDNQFTSLEPKDEIWRWSLNYNDELVEKKLSIPAHQMREFKEVVWNIQTDEKEQIRGMVAIVGELVSTPGGKSRAIQIKIN
ncbi:MAG: hypothetical protein H6696_09190 [Deferribacteres bacterium]|nr:hypothetical protein [candidate division KSB1 bacterium]MCB9502100.1 hypothetical protein [Deferribacteres bacterium]